MQTKLFRDGKPVKANAEIPVEVKDATSDRMLVTDVVRLTPDLEPGKYFVQVAITEKTTKDKQAPVVQWVEFEIVK
jgi:ribosome-binding factor A